MTDADALFTRGAAALQAGDNREAVECFTRAIAAAPRVAAGYRHRARAYLGLRDRPRAVADLDMAIALEPGDAQLLAERAAELLKQKQFDRAIDDCNLAMALDPGRTDVYGLRGQCHAGRGDTAAALADYAAAGMRDAEQAAAFLTLRARLLFEIGDFTAAVNAAEEALLVNADFAPAYEARALARQRLGDLPGAADDFAAATERDPQALVPLLGRGLVLFELHDWAGAELAAEAVLVLRAGFLQALELRGRSQQNRGDLAGALRTFDELVAKSPRAMALNLRGQLHCARNDFPAAIRDHLEALKLDPRNLAALNQLAWLWATCPDDAVRNGARAKECATRACEISEWGDAGPLDTLAAACAECGDFAAAVQWQERAVATAEGDDAYRDRLAMYRRGEPYRVPARVG